MKTGLVTFYHIHHYGALLQACATEQAVKRLGSECEIIDYYVSKRPEKSDHYQLIKEHRDKVFIQSIPVYTIHLRPYKLEAGELHFEGTNALFNMMTHYAARINDDRYKINQKNKPKTQLLYNLQMKYMELDEEINQILSGKKGSRVLMEHYIEIYS